MRNVHTSVECGWIRRLDVSKSFKFPDATMEAAPPTWAELEMKLMPVDAGPYPVSETCIAPPTSSAVFPMELAFVVAKDSDSPSDRAKAPPLAPDVLFTKALDALMTRVELRKSYDMRSQNQGIPPHPRRLLRLFDVKPVFPIHVRSVTQEKSTPPIDQRSFPTNCVVPPQEILDRFTYCTGHPQPFQRCCR